MLVTNCELDDDEYEDHGAFVYLVENPPSEFGISTNGCDPYNFHRGFKKHLIINKNDLTISDDRLKEYSTT